MMAGLIFWGGMFFAAAVIVFVKDALVDML